MNEQEYLQTLINKKKKTSSSKEIIEQQERIRQKIIKKEGNVIYVQFRDEEKVPPESSESTEKPKILEPPLLSQKLHMSEINSPISPPNEPSRPEPHPSPTETPHPPSSAPERPNTPEPLQEPPPPPPPQGPTQPPQPPHPSKSWKRILAGALGLTAATLGGVFIGRYSKECPTQPERQQPLTPPDVAPSPPPTPLPPEPKLPPSPAPQPPPPPSAIPPAPPKTPKLQPQPIPQDKALPKRAEQRETPPKQPAPPALKPEPVLVPIKKLPPEQRFHYSLAQVRHGFYSAIENTIMEDIRQAINKNPLLSRSIALETATKNQKRAQQIMIQHGMKLDPDTFHKLCQIASTSNPPLQDILKNAEFLNKLEQQVKTVSPSTTNRAESPAR